MKPTSILHSNGQSASFDPKILHESLVLACLSVRASEGEAKAAAQRTTEQVAKWLKGKEEVTSEDIRRVAARYLKTYHPEAAYLYKQARVMI